MEYKITKSHAAVKADKLNAAGAPKRTAKAIAEAIREISKERSAPYVRRYISILLRIRPDTIFLCGRPDRQLNRSPFKTTRKAQKAQ